MKELKTTNNLLEQVQKELIEALQHSDMEKMADCQKKLVDAGATLMRIILLGKYLFMSNFTIDTKRSSSFNFR